MINNIKRLEGANLEGVRGRPHGDRRARLAAASGDADGRRRRVLMRDDLRPALLGFPAGQQIERRAEHPQQDCL